VKHKQNSRLPKTLLRFIPAYLLPALALSAEGLVELQLQHSKDLVGPWEPRKIESHQLRNGNILLRDTGRTGFYRLALLGVQNRDADGDGVIDSLDNCPLLPNPGQTDVNSNGIGDISEDPFMAPGDEQDSGDPFEHMTPEEFREVAQFPSVLSVMPDYTIKPANELDFIPSDRDLPLPAPRRKSAGGSSSSDDYPSGLEGDEDGDRGSLDNYLLLELGSHLNAGSNVSGIELHIGGFTVVLAAPTSGFQPNQTLKYDFNNSSCPSCWNTMDPDDWDTIILENSSRDGLQIERVVLVHSSETVLESSPGAWLDSYYGRKLDFSLETGMTRWNQLFQNRATALYYAVQDLGQTGAGKYVTSDVAWCSEFASWALRQTGLSTPTGSISTNTLQTYFQDRSRYFDKSDCEAGSYSPRAGDYISYNAGNHSVLFVEWTSKAGAQPADGDKFLTIEGNVSNAVVIRERSWSNVEFVGQAR
jgi:hypothetical protein